jgi:ATP-dependent helicase/nuclease subunit A
MKARLRKAFRTRANQGDRTVMNRWRDLERRVETTRITTIHSFCAGILREHALLLGIDPEFSLLAEAEQHLFVDRVITEVLHDLLEAGDEAVVTLAETMRFSAIAGLLKTLHNTRDAVAGFSELFRAAEDRDLETVLRDRALKAHGSRLRLLSRHPEPARLLRQLRDFDGCCTKVDARETKRQAACALLETLIADGTADKVASALAEFEAISNRGGSKKNWGDEETWADLLATLKSVGEWVKKNLAPPTFDDTTEAEAARLTRALWQVYTHTAQALAARKAAVNALDFDDLLERARDAVCNNSTLCARAAARIQYLLIDEFQDTDGIQLDLALALSNHPDGPDLFIVGDAKQSIYRFRGADVAVFSAQRERSEVLPLRQNFRSLPDVLKFVNAYYRDSQSLWAVEPAFQDLETYRDPAGGARIEFLLTGDGDGGEDWNKLQGREEEARMLAHRIRALCSGEDGPTVWDEDRACFRTPEPGDMAILFRTMSNVAVYEDALREAGVPYTLLAGGGFYERQEVIDFLNILKVILDPWDEGALVAFLRSPIGALSDVDLYWMAQEGFIARVFHGTEIPEDMPHPDRLARARACITHLLHNRERPLGALLQEVLNVTEYEAMCLGMPQGTQRVANLRKILDLAHTFARTQAGTLRAFVAYLDDVRSQAVREGEAALQPERAGAVSIMSVHKSKGLEFGIVFLADMAGGGGGHTSALQLHPHWGMVLKPTLSDGETSASGLCQMIQAHEKIEEEAETARLLYVAMTRARDALVLCATAVKARDGWMGDLDKTFGVIDMEDGETFSGPGWEAVVRRMFEQAPALQHAPNQKEKLPAHEAISAQISPVAAIPAKDGAISISRLLNAMFHEAQEAESEDVTPIRYSPGRSRALARGNAVHAWFERWDFPGAAPDPVPLLRDEGLGSADRVAIAREIADIEAWFRTTDLHAELCAAAGLQREAPFTWRLADHTISGTIDLLAGEVSVVDYKTGARKSESHARYETQLRLYAAAVSDLLGFSLRSGYLVYVDTREVATVSLEAEEVAEARRAAEQALPGLTAPAMVG